MVRILFVLVLVNAFSAPCGRADANQIFDLGQLEVMGDVKKPGVFLLESGAARRRLLQAETARSLADLEKRLLMRTPAPSGASEKGGNR